MSAALAQGEPPPGGGPPGQGGGPPPPPGGGSRSCKLKGAFTLDGGTKKTTNKTYKSDKQDVSAVLVTNGGNLTLHNPTIATSANTSSHENSSFYGLNAGVVATKGSTVTISGGTVTTTGSGANGLFATGSGASVIMNGGSIKATADGAHGVMATEGASLKITNVNITTSGDRAADIATDRGGGTIAVTGGKVASSGPSSPGIYSTGDITVSEVEIHAAGAEAAVIEGRNSITVKDSALSSGGKCGVMIYQSFSGDAGEGTGTFTMTGGSLTVGVGPAFYVNNTRALVTLKEVKINVASGTLLNAAAGRWGRSGSNGGTVNFIADTETLSGQVTADSISAISLALRNHTTLTGAIKDAALTLDSTSRWIVTADSTLTGLTDPGGISGSSITNIRGNGHTVHYNPRLPGTKSLGGRTYSLAGGGRLAPK